jgi:hypothetical protein
MEDCNEKYSDKSHIGFGYLEYTAQNCEGFPFWQTLTQSDKRLNFP